MLFQDILLETIEIQRTAAVPCAPSGMWWLLFHICPVGMNFLFHLQYNISCLKKGRAASWVTAQPLTFLLLSRTPLQLLTWISLLLPLLAAAVESEKAVCVDHGGRKGGGVRPLSASLLISDGGHGVAAQPHPDDFWHRMSNQNHTCTHTHTHTHWIWIQEPWKPHPWGLLEHWYN